MLLADVDCLYVICSEPSGQSKQQHFLRGLKKLYNNWMLGGFSPTASVKDLETIRLRQLNTAEKEVRGTTMSIANHWDYMASSAYESGEMCTYHHKEGITSIGATLPRQASSTGSRRAMVKETSKKTALQTVPTYDCNEGSDG